MLSLLAESQERSGRDAAAADAYVRSLALGPDLYTGIAYSDLLLRTGKARQALQILKRQPIVVLIEFAVVVDPPVTA